MTAYRFKKPVSVAGKAGKNLVKKNKKEEKPNDHNGTIHAAPANNV